eukprot:7725434-Pyramimonas_sp.AAC.1
MGACVVVSMCAHCTFLTKKGSKELRRPFVTAAVWNDVSSEVQKLPVLGKLRAVVVNSGVPTCRVGKVWRELDYAVVSHDLVGEVRACARREDSSNTTHYPVSHRLDPMAHQRTQRVLKVPMAFPLDQPPGPAPPPQDWTFFEGEFERLRRQPSRAELSLLYGEMCDSMVRELSDVLGIEAADCGEYCGKGTKFQVVEKPVLQKHGLGPFPRRGQE